MASWAPVLSSTQLLRGASAPLIHRLAAETHARRYHEGEAIWHAQDPATHFVLIHRGLVQILRGGASPTVLALFGPRESIGDTAAIEGTGYPADAVALSPLVEVLLVPAPPVREAMEKDASLATSIRQALLAHGRALHAKIDVLSAGEVPARLATLLLSLAERFGDEHDDGAISIPLDLSRKTLALLVGARVETVIRVMTAWQRQGTLRTEPDGFVIVDASALRALRPAP